MTRIPGLLEMYYQPVFDTAKIDKNTEQSLLFQVPVGQEGKTPLETNMTGSGFFPYPRNFKLQGFSVIPDLSANIDDVKRYVDRTWFRFVIQKKDYLVVPLSLVFDTTNYETMGLADALLNSLLKQKGNQPVYKLPEVSTIDIIPQMSFRVELNSKLDDQVFSPFNLKVVLFGHTLREVH